jgi:predicted lipid-binding transport protein (Tim44 family)
MEFDWSRVINIVIGLAALVIGWAIGFFDSKMRADKKIRQAEERSELAVQQAKGEAERAALAAQAARAAAEAKPSLPGTSLLRLWLDSSDRPALDLDGQRVDTDPISVSDRKRLLALITVMRPWIEGRPAAPAPAPTPAPSTPATPRPTAASAPVPAAASAPAPAAKPVPPAVKEEKPAAPVSIVGQIDEILQARLAVSPLANRAIRLTESPEGTVIVWVGLQKFMGVGEVTDPEVQAVIRAAITEWEKKYTPG